MGDGEQFVVGLARRLVTGLAPDELSVFDLVAAEFLRDPGRVLKARVRPGETLALGIDTIVLETTTVALAVGTAVHQYLLDRSGEFVVDRTVRLVKKLRRRKQTGELPEITPDLCEGAVDGTRRLILDMTGDAALADQCGALVRVALTQGPGRGDTGR
ncbi:hypothetical protein [Actinoplanes sp. NPDC049265]|uniref:hypothetical protein n=1 Tax=Actinoplanes sp. NPDC049265 TaxID=3363902 RepID=UPI003716F52B